MNMRKLILVSVMIMAAFGLLVAPQTAIAGPDAAPVRLTFDKTLVDPAGVWQGTIGGDVDGDLTTVLTALEVSGAIWLVEFDWIVDTDDEQSFTAHLSGILNTNTGKVVMNGTVVEGWLLGAQVHEEGQLVDAQTLQFQGTIRIMPQSAG